MNGRDQEFSESKFQDKNEPWFPFEVIKIF